MIRLLRKPPTSARLVNIASATDAAGLAARCSEVTTPAAAVRVRIPACVSPVCNIKVRMHSSAAEAVGAVPKTSGDGAGGSCPFASGSSSSSENSSNVNTKANKSDEVRLIETPSLPYVGSWYIGDLPSMAEPYDFWIQLYKRNGNFYSIGLPGLGSTNTSHGTLHVITSPHEMLKVVRDGGKYPSGLGEVLWMNKKWAKDNRLKMVAGENDGFMGRGKDWKRLRTFMQTDLLHPDSARGYLPGILEAAKLASKGAQASKKELNKFLNLCAFDMFSTIMFGEFTKTAGKGIDAATAASPENVEFIRSSVQALSTAVTMTRSPYEGLIGRLLGIQTKQYTHFSEGMDVAWEVGNNKIDRFMERKQNGQLNENEKASYLNRAVDRQAEEGSNVTLEEVKELAWNGIFAGVDTTSGVLGWNLTHIARLPEVQEKLYKELSNAVAETGGEVTAAVLDRSVTPYLHAVVRESQRLTPPGSISIVKTLQAPVTIHGVPLAKGEVVAFDGRSTGMDPMFVDDPEDFIPERWLLDAVAARKGSPRELVDHVYYKDPFSQGARKCPGSRVAVNEILVMLSQLVLDWKISSPVSSMSDLKFGQRTTVEVEIPELEFEPRA